MFRMPLFFVAMNYFNQLLLWSLFHCLSLICFPFLRRSRIINHIRLFHQRRVDKVHFLLRCFSRLYSLGLNFYLFTISSSTTWLCFLAFLWLTILGFLILFRQWFFWRFLKSRRLLSWRLSFFLRERFLFWWVVFDLIYSWTQLLDDLLIVLFEVNVWGLNFEFLGFYVLCHLDSAVAGFAEGS